MLIDVKRGPRGGIKKPIELDIILEKGDELHLMEFPKVGLNYTLTLNDGSKLNIKGEKE